MRCNLRLLTAVTVLMLAIASCKKFVMIDPPIDRITSQTIFSNNQTAMSAVLGVYSNMMMTEANIFTGATTIYNSLTADELVYNSTTEDIRSFYTNSIAATNSIIGDQFWTRAYGILYQVNACIEGLQHSTGVTDSAKKQLLGEMKLVRGFINFYLVNLFGDVPLVLTTTYTVNAMLPRTPKEQVWRQVVTDITDAASLLGNSYPTAGRVRPAKAAAIALLARVYLYREEWAKAEAAASEVIANNSYSLVANTDNIFLATSSEAIWQLAPVVPGFNTIEGNRFVPGTATARPQFSLSTQLQNAFEPGDKRKISWTKINVSAGTPYMFPYKYKVRSGTAVTENYVLLRLAELYMVRAEARAQQDNTVGAKADINMIRARAGLPATVAATKTEVLAAIEKERRIELFAEWGHRWLDLKRWNKTDAVLAPVKPGWQTYMQLYPVPNSQLLTNPSLTQNPGY